MAVRVEVPRGRRRCRVRVNLDKPGGCRAGRRTRGAYSRRGLPSTSCWFYMENAARERPRAPRAAYSRSGRPCVRPVNLLDAVEAEPARERLGHVELAAGNVRAAVDHLHQNRRAVVGGEDARTA